MSEMDRSAHISQCWFYRYSLTRIWDQNLGRVLFIMLNPSKADGLQDDPTLRRCMGLAAAWGYGQLEVVNLFAYRTPNPRDLVKESYTKGLAYVVGPENDDCIKGAVSRADLIVAAWGANRIVHRRVSTVYQLLEGRKVHALALTKSGQPKHPLYLRRDLKPMPFGGGAL